MIVGGHHHIVTCGHHITPDRRFLAILDHRLLDIPGRRIQYLNNLRRDTFYAKMAYLNEWGVIEREHSLPLCGANEDLQSSTLRVPVTRGAMVDIESLKSSLWSTMQVMETLRSSIHSTLSMMEGPSCLVSELVTVVAQERALVDECEILLVSAVSLQVLQDLRRLRGREKEKMRSVKNDALS